MKFSYCLSALALFILPACGQTPPVPASFQGLYSDVDQNLTTFNAALNPEKTAVYPVVYTASLPDADANCGPELIASVPNQGVQLQLQELKAMGVQGIMVEVGFPMLYRPFFANQSVYQQYVAFYAQVAASVRALGLKLVVENDAIVRTSPAAAAWNTNAYMSAMSWQQYQQARAQAAAVIAQTMHPDYLVLLQEPDTEAANSGQAEVDTPAGASMLLAGMLASVRQADVSGLQVGAGVGTWLYGFQGFIQSFVALPVNFIDIHIYPVNKSYLQNALTIAGIAAAAGLPVTMSESWLHKLLDSELGTMTQDQVRARDVYSFWAPLDAYFLTTLHNLGNYTRMTFLNVFASNYFWTYLPYDSTVNMTPQQMLQAEQQQAELAIQQGIFSSTGMSYYHELVPTQDKTPPAAPTSVSAVSGSSTAVMVSWSGSTDNVGVVGYYVLRNGIQIGTTARTYYQDTGLTKGSTYSYVVEAFDLAGNVSPASLPAQVTTKKQ